MLMANNMAFLRTYSKWALDKKTFLVGYQLFTKKFVPLLYFLFYFTYFY